MLLATVFLCALDATAADDSESFREVQQHARTRESALEGSLIRFEALLADERTQRVYGIEQGEVAISWPAEKWVTRTLVIADELKRPLLAEWSPSLPPAVRDEFTRLASPTVWLYDGGRPRKFTPKKQEWNGVIAEKLTSEMRSSPLRCGFIALGTWMSEAWKKWELEAASPLTGTMRTFLLSYAEPSGSVTLSRIQVDSAWGFLPRRQLITRASDESRRRAAAAVRLDAVTGMELAQGEVVVFDDVVLAADKVGGVYVPSRFAVRYVRDTDTLIAQGAMQYQMGAIDAAGLRGEVARGIPHETGTAVVSVRDEVTGETIEYRDGRSSQVVPPQSGPRHGDGVNKGLLFVVVGMASLLAMLALVIVRRRRKALTGGSMTPRESSQSGEAKGPPGSHLYGIALGLAAVWPWVASKDQDLVEVVNVTASPDGVRTPGGRREWWCQVRNISTQDTSLEVKHLSCSCINPRVDTPILPPGQVGRVTIEMDRANESPSGFFVIRARAGRMEQHERVVINRERPPEPRAGFRIAPSLVICRGSLGRVILGFAVKGDVPVSAGVVESTMGVSRSGVPIPSRVRARRDEARDIVVGDITFDVVLPEDGELVLDVSAGPISGLTRQIVVRREQRVSRLNAESVTEPPTSR